MVLLLHEQRHSAYSLLSCHILCLFDSTFFIFKGLFYLNSEQVGENTIGLHIGEDSKAE